MRTGIPTETGSPCLSEGSPGEFKQKQLILPDAIEFGRIGIVLMRGAADWRDRQESLEIWRAQFRTLKPLRRIAEGGRG